MPRNEDVDIGLDMLTSVIFFYFIAEFAKYSTIEIIKNQVPGCECKPGSMSGSILGPIPEYLGQYLGKYLGQYLG